MHGVMRTEQSVPEKSITGTPLRTAGSSSAFVQPAVATQHHVAERSGYRPHSGYGAAPVHSMRDVKTTEQSETEKSETGTHLRTVFSDA